MRPACRRRPPRFGEAGAQPLCTTLALPRPEHPETTASRRWYTACTAQPGMAMKTFRASVVQTLARLGDLDENIGILRARTAEAVGQGASLVVFPECMNTGYLFDSRAHCLELAEPTDGRYAQAMSQ